MSGSTSPLRPSASHQWVNCPGSVMMQSLHPEYGEASYAAEEGTACHWLAEQLLNCISTQCELPDKESMINTTAPNGIVMDEDMWDGANMYVDTVMSMLGNSTPVDNLQVEQEIKLDNIYPLMHGTADCWFYDAYTLTLHVFDLKYGRGGVEVFANSQLLIYASGIIANILHPDVGNDERLKVNLTIVQPRSYHELGPVRTWKTKAVDMITRINIIEFAANLAMGDEPDCKAGRHCKYCSGKYVCSSLQNTVYEAIDVITDVSPDVMDEESLAAELTLLKYASDLIKYRLIAIEEQAKSVINNGSSLKGWMVAPTFGRKKWEDKEQAKLMGEMMGVNLSKNELVTPTQAKALFKKAKVDSSVIDTYSTTPKNGVKLVIDDGSRLSMIFNNK